MNDSASSPARPDPQVESDDAVTPPSDTAASPAATDNATLGEPTPLAFRAVRSGLWLLGSSYWSLGLGFVANILLTRLLTPAIYGEFALAMFFYSLFQLRSKLGLNYAFAQQRVVNGESVGTLLILDVLLGLGGLIVTAVAAPILLSLGYARTIVTIMLVMAALSFAESFVSVFGVVLETELRFKPISIITSVAMPLSYIPAFWLATHAGGQYSLLAQTATFSLLSMAAGIGYIARAQRDLLRFRWRYQGALAVSYLRFGVTAGVGNFVAGMVTQTDNFLLGTISGVTTLGYYDRAYRMAQWPALLLNAVVARAAVFTYSQLCGDDARLWRASTMMLWITANVATPVVLALFLCAPDLVPLLFGAQWAPVVPILRVLLIVAVVRPLWENLGALFIGLGQPQRIIEVSLVQLVAVVVIGVPMAYALGAVGMALAVVLALFTGLAVAYYFMRRLVHLNLWDIFAGPLLATGLTLAGYYIFVRAIPNSYPQWLAVVWKIAYAFAAYLLFSALVRPGQLRERTAYVYRLLRSRSA